MKTTILLLLLLLHLTVQAAVPVGGVRINSDSTGTNTRSAAITVTLQTNLNSGVVNATNSVNVGQTGQAGVVNIGSTTTTNFFILTTTSTNALVSINATDDFDHAALTIIVTNEISSADLLHLQNGTNVKVYIQYDGSILGRRLFAEASPASDDFTRIQPTDFKINSGTNTNYFEVHLGNAEINWFHEGTNAFKVVADSGYGAGGIRVLTDQGGTYLDITTIGGGGGNVFNTGTPAARRLPVYSDTTGTNVVPSTAIVDAAGQISSTNAWIFANGNSVATAGSTNTFTNKTLDYSGAGNVINQRRSIKLQIPRFVDGSGCMATNTNYVALDNFMVPVFSGTADTNANYCYWITRVPEDFNAAGAEVTASLTVTLGGTDADAATFTLGMVAVANGAAGLSATATTYNTITVTPTSAAAGDAESSNANAMTGWAAAMTANRFWKIQLQRVNNSNDDAIAMQELEIFYDALQ